MINKKILIHVGYSKFPFDRTDLDNGTLAGTEYCAIRLAESLFQLGNQVTIHGEVKNSICNGVEYVSLGNLSSKFFDIVIGVAYGHLFEILNEYRISFDKCFFWLHNEEPFIWYKGEELPDIEQRLFLNKNLSGIVLVSQAHKECFSNRYSYLPVEVLEAKTNVIENGYDVFDYDSSKVDKITNRIIWSSGIDRGLSSILTNWGKIKKEVPNASFVICAPKYSENFNFDTALFEQQDVVWLGQISKERLKQEQLKAQWWLYPGDYFETFCLTELEMMNSKVRCLTSNGSNLKYLGSENRAVFLNSINPNQRLTEAINLIKQSGIDKTLELKLTTSSNQALDWINRFNWDKKVQEWIKLFQNNKL